MRLDAEPGADEARLTANLFRAGGATDLATGGATAEQKNTRRMEHGALHASWFAYAWDVITRAPSHDTYLGTALRAAALWQ